MSSLVLPICAGEVTGLTGGVISLLMGFQSPVGGAGSFRSSPSRTQTAIAPSCSAQSPSRQVDLFLRVSDRWGNGWRQPTEAEPVRLGGKDRQVLTTLRIVDSMVQIVQRQITLLWRSPVHTVRIIYMGMLVCESIPSIIMGHLQKKKTLFWLQLIK